MNNKYFDSRVVVIAVTIIVVTSAVAKQGRRLDSEDWGKIYSALFRRR